MTCDERVRDLLWALQLQATVAGDRIVSRAVDELWERLDRAEDRTMRLPLDRDGVPVRPGDTVTTDDGTRYVVCAVGNEEPSVRAVRESETGVRYEYAYAAATLSHAARGGTPTPVAEEIEAAATAPGLPDWQCVSRATLRRWADELRRDGDEPEVGEP